MQNKLYAYYKVNDFINLAPLYSKFNFYMTKPSEKFKYIEIKRWTVKTDGSVKPEQFK